MNMLGKYASRSEVYFRLACQTWQPTILIRIHLYFTRNEASQETLMYV